jgi:hypothetical protein
MDSRRFTERNNGFAFEAECEALCALAGWKIDKTPVVGDFGVDLVLSKGTIKVAVQCKDWTGTVSLAAVQEVAAGRKHVGAQHAVVVSRSGAFTRSAKALAASNDVHLANLAGLRRQLQKLSPKTDEPKRSPVQHNPAGLYFPKGTVVRNRPYRAPDPVKSGFGPTRPSVPPPAVPNEFRIENTSPSYSACHGTGGCLSGERGSGGACFVAMLVRFVNGVGVDGIG